MSSQPPSGPRSNGCIAEAALLLARDHGAADRLLAAHRPLPDGRCAGCGRSPSRWPCVLVVIAEQARTLTTAGPAHMSTPSVPARPGRVVHRGTA
ncbi:MAG: hypothetical protein ACRDRK_13795 [Pseudonocardia sp.]